MVGKPNRYAHAAALTVAERPSMTHNPLVLHGGTGLGKSHLLRAIAAYIDEAYPSARVHLVSSEELLVGMIDYVRRGGGEKIPARFADVDALLVDDIDLAARGPGTCQEIAFLFRRLRDAGCQVVVTLTDRDRASQLLVELRRVFAAGLEIDLEPLDRDLRAELVTAFAAQTGATLRRSVVDCLAGSHLGGHELRGAVQQLRFIAEQSGRPATRADAAELAFPRPSADPLGISPLGSGGPLWATVIKEVPLPSAGPSGPKFRPARIAPAGLDSPTAVGGPLRDPGVTVMTGDGHRWLACALAWDVGVRNQRPVVLCRAGFRPTQPAWELAMAGCGRPVALDSHGEPERSEAAHARYLLDQSPIYLANAVDASEALPVLSNRVAQQAGVPVALIVVEIHVPPHFFAPPGRPYPDPTEHGLVLLCTDGAPNAAAVFGVDRVVLCDNVTDEGLDVLAIDDIPPADAIVGASADELDIPRDHSGALLGWRTWDVDDFGSGPVLVSPVQHTRWPRGVLDAGCPDPSRPHRYNPDLPAVPCRCGIYAFARLGHAALTWKRARVSVLGQVRGWGRVRRHALGFRAEHAQVHKLYVRGGEVDPVALGDAYDCDVEALEPDFFDLTSST